MTDLGATAHCVAHIPGLLLAPNDRTPLGDGELTELSFEEWQALETEFQWADRHFERSRPAFFRMSLTGAANADEWRDDVVGAFTRARTRVHRSFLLATAPWLPEPALSVSYLQFDDTVSLLIGAYGREHILYPPGARVPLDEEAKHRVSHAYATLSRDAERAPDGVLEGAFRTLERTTRPEFGFLNAFIHKMIALEQLLLPDVRTRLTQTFARRMSVMLANGAGQLAEASAMGRALYVARSELIHGRDVNRALERFDTDLSHVVALGHWAFAVVLSRVAAWRATAPEGSPLELAILRAGLDDVARDPAQFGVLSGRWADSP